MYQNVSEIVKWWHYFKDTLEPRFAGAKRHDGEWQMTWFYELKTLQCFSILVSMHEFGFDFYVTGFLYFFYLFDFHLTSILFHI